MGAGYHGGFGDTKGGKAEIIYYSDDVEYEEVVSSGMKFLAKAEFQPDIITGEGTGFGISQIKRKIGKFELYCAFYSLLKLKCDFPEDMELKEYLLKANPFDSPYQSSKEPQVYISFCNIVKGRITIKNSYCLINKYVQTLNVRSISKYFSNISQQKWMDFFKNYLVYIN